MYVAFDNRHITPAPWLLNNFTLTDISFKSNEHSYTVYKRVVPAGEFRFGSNNYMNWPQRAFVDHFIFIMLPFKVIVGAHEEQHDLEVFPNPVADKFQVSWKQLNDEAEIKLTDLNGKIITEVKCVECDHLIVETHSAPAGMYLLQIKTGDSFYYKKIIKFE